MADITDGDADTTFVGSHEKAKNSFGQNGFQGPSSDLPGQRTVMDREFGLKDDPDLGGVTTKPTETGNWQTRAVSAEPYTAHPGMKARNDKIDFPTGNVRKSSVPVNPKSFQR
jgi:hypothetical protein